VAFIATVLLFVAVVVFSQIPSRDRVRGCLKTEMYGVELCPGSEDYAPLKRISKHLQQAVVVTEDSAFWDHRGFDFQEIQRSFEKNLEQGRFARGGSTISQQLAKNMFLNSEKSLQRKLLEALITLQLERHLSKKEILERYLNVVQFGPKIYGVKAASQFYFKKSSADLDLIEAAWLAYLLPSPDKYSVSFFKKKLTPFARKRLRQITANMYRYQRATEEDYRRSIGRLDTFLTGGPAVDVPEGLDLDAPEELEGEPEFLPEVPAMAPIDGESAPANSEGNDTIESFPEKPTGLPTDAADPVQSDDLSL
jgi:monofunctional biosynthetic peptidoglycan transglycosylase